VAAVTKALRTRQESREPRRRCVNAADKTARRGLCFWRRQEPLVKESLVADLVFVVLTVVLFAALTVLIRAVERW